VAAGDDHSLGLTQDGRVLAWGRDDDGQCQVPEFAGQVSAIMAGGGTSLALMGPAIVSLEPAPLPMVADPGNWLIRQVMPNPFNPEVQVEYECLVAGEVRLEVFNLLGQPVCRVDLGQRPAGTGVAHWNGRTGTGRDAASGTYWLRISSDAGASRAVRAVLAR
jgi:hypothetical protein